MTHEENIEKTILEVHSFADSPLLKNALRGAFKGMIEIGRLTVLEDFDNICEADAFIGFSSEEWQAVKKFFAYNKAITKWDNQD